MTDKQAADVKPPVDAHKKPDGHDGRVDDPKDHLQSTVQQIQKDGNHKPTAAETARGQADAEHAYGKLEIHDGSASPQSTGHEGEKDTGKTVARPGEPAQTDAKAGEQPKKDEQPSWWQRSTSWVEHQASNVANVASGAADIAGTAIVGAGEAAVHAGAAVVHGVENGAVAAAHGVEKGAEWAYHNPGKAAAIAGVAVAVVGAEIATGGAATAVIAPALEAAVAGGGALMASSTVATGLEVAGVAVAGYSSGKAVADVANHGEAGVLMDPNASAEQKAAARKQLKADTGDAVLADVTVGAGLALKAVTATAESAAALNAVKTAKTAADTGTKTVTVVEDTAKSVTQAATSGDTTAASTTGQVGHAGQAEQSAEGAKAAHGPAANDDHGAAVRADTSVTQPPRDVSVPREVNEAPVKPEPKPDKSYEAQFTPEQHAQINDMAKTQKSMPALNLEPEEIRERAAAELAKTTAEQGKRLDIIVGPPGAGKSTTFVDPLMKDFGGRLIDPDKLKPALPGYAGGLGADAVHIASSKIAGDMFEMALKNGDSIVLPKLGKDAAGLSKIIDQAKDAGYSVNLHLADIPPEVSAQRSFARAFPEDGSIGQWVNPKQAFDAGTKPAETFEELIARRGYIDGFSHYNMDVPKNTPPILVKQTQALAA